MGYGSNVFAVAGKTISVDGINEAVDVFKVLSIAKENMRKVAGLTQTECLRVRQAWLSQTTLVGPVGPVTRQCSSSPE